MIELFLVIAPLIAGFVVGWKYREYVAIENLNQVMHHAEKSNVIDIKIEKTEGQLFVYNRTTSEYMAHAKTRDSLEEILRQKYPGKSFNASLEDIEKLNESV